MKLRFVTVILSDIIPVKCNSTSGSFSVQEKSFFISTYIKVLFCGQKNGSFCGQMSQIDSQIHSKLLPQKPE
jgi:hypothetical protein